MSGSKSQLSTEVMEGVYLCSKLDLPELFGSEMDALPNIRMYRPEDVPDPARIRFALVWQPTDDAFEAYPNIELVQVIAAGVDGVLRTPSLPESTVVTRVHDHEQAAVMAGFAVWNVVWHHRHMGSYLAAQANKDWERISLKTLRQPSTITVGILGYGLMGRTIAAAVGALGFNVVVATRTAGTSEDGVSRIAGPGAIQQVAARSDILINILPMTDATLDILNSDLFDAMPKGAALIQLARGQHLVEDDLLLALDSGQLSGASLDVFRVEPLPKDHPFWGHPKIVITPHEASVTSPAAVAQALDRSVRELSAGERPSTAVNTAAGY